MSEFLLKIKTGDIVWTSYAPPNTPRGEKGYRGIFYAYNERHQYGLIFPEAPKTGHNLNFPVAGKHLIPSDHPHIYRGWWVKEHHILSIETPYKFSDEGYSEIFE